MVLPQGWRFLTACILLLATQSGTSGQNYWDTFSHSSAVSGAFQQLPFCQETVEVNPPLLKFSEWSFSNTSVLLQLPVDPETRNFVRKVPNAIFSVVLPTPLSSPPILVAIADTALSELLDLDPCNCISSEHFVHFIAGSWPHPQGTHLAHRYGGHQFGLWAGQLGDGRAVLLGEYCNKRGEHWELQLKGSGRTPYSRNGDGRAVLRSSVREFLVSEAMHYLGVPTSRVASLVVSNERAWRDQFYDGHPRKERTGVVLRLAPSWFRIGSLEILYYSREFSLLKQLVDLIIEHHFPHITGPLKYVELFATVVNMTAQLIAQWQAVGFAHGVCNTDNFSLLSLTIDYGPFGFMESYDPDFVPNTSDDEGRYRFGNQPHVGLYNLEKLMQAMRRLLEKDWERAEEALHNYAHVFNAAYLGLMRQKLGLIGEDESDETLLVRLLELMQATQADYTMTLRELSEISMPGLLSGVPPQNYYWTLPRLQQYPEWKQWVKRYAARAETGHPAVSYREGLRMQRMQAANPRYILRNYMAERAIQLAEQGDYSEIHKLYRVLKRPFVRVEEAEAVGYAGSPPVWASSLRVSCSS